jgi:hypothetical protein
MNQIKWLLLSLAILLYSGCGLNEQGIIERFNERAADIQQEYAPDLSLNVFSAALSKEKGQWILKGETTIPEASQTVIAVTDSLLGQKAYENNFTLLPEPAFGDSTRAIVAVSVANLRREPRHSAEMVDQTILGRPIKLLKRHRSWLMVQTDYGYIGWIQGGSLVRTDEAGMQAWEKGGMVRFTDLFGFVYSEPDPSSVPVSDLVVNARLNVLDRGRTWTRVLLPRGDIGYVDNARIEVDRAYELPPETRIENIIATAKRMMGVPYLWGGNSSKANDCSGFTQTVFKANGIQLPRDARQQIHMGTEVVPDENFSNIKAGDLFFFGSEDRITHVGIGLGGAEFIHQSSWVHINSLDPEAENFNAYRKRTFVTIKRIF